MQIERLVRRVSEAGLRTNSRANASWRVAFNLATPTRDGNPKVLYPVA